MRLSVLPAAYRLVARARRPSAPIVLAALLAAVVVATHSLLLQAMGDFLIAAEPLEPADAIVVLAGQSSTRAERAVELYRAGLAPRLIVSDERIRTHGLSATWAELYRAGVARLPVPESVVTILPLSTSTYDEAVWSREVLRQHGLRSAIVVTDAFHSRRSGLVFRRQFEPAGLVARVSPAGDPATALKGWWLDEDKALNVLSEYGKLTYYVVRGWLF